MSRAQTRTEASGSRSRADAAWDDPPSTSAAPNQHSRNRVEPTAAQVHQDQDRRAAHRQNGQHPSHVGTPRWSNPNSAHHHLQHSNHHGNHTHTQHASYGSDAFDPPYTTHDEELYCGDGHGCHADAAFAVDGCDEDWASSDGWYGSQRDEGDSHVPVFSQADHQQFWESPHAAGSGVGQHDHPPSDEHPNACTARHAAHDSFHRSFHHDSHGHPSTGLPHSHRTQTAAGEGPDGPEEYSGAHGPQNAYDDHEQDEGEWQANSQEGHDAPGWYQDENGNSYYWPRDWYAEMGGEGLQGWSRNADGSLAYWPQEGDEAGFFDETPHDEQAASENSRQNPSDASHRALHVRESSAPSEHASGQTSVSPGMRNAMMNGRNQHAPEWRPQPQGSYGGSTNEPSPSRHTGPPQQQQRARQTDNTSSLQSHNSSSPSYATHAGGPKPGPMPGPSAGQKFAALRSASSRGSEGGNLVGGSGEGSHAWTDDRRAGGALEGLVANQPQGPHAAGYAKKLQEVGLCLSYAATGACPKGMDCKLVHGHACPVRICLSQSKKLKMSRLYTSFDIAADCNRPDCT